MIIWHIITVSLPLLATVEALHGSLMLQHTVPRLGTVLPAHTAAAVELPDADINKNLSVKGSAGVAPEFAQGDLLTESIHAGTSKGTQDSGVSFKRVSEGSSSKQVLLYLPGIEGLGLSAEAAQFPALMQSFDLYCMQIESRDRTPFAKLVDTIAEFLETVSTEPVILCGESFGGVLALSLAYTHPDKVSSVFLINPATSFDRSPWPTLAPLLTRAPGNIYTIGALITFIATIPDITQIADVAGILLDPRRNTPAIERPEALIRRLVSLWSQIGQVASNLPRETLGFRIQNWLIEGTLWLNPKLQHVQQPVTIIAGTSDRLLPSASEAKRLAKILPDSEVVLLRGHGHAALFDARCSLSKIITSSSSVTLKDKDTDSIDDNVNNDSQNQQAKKTNKRTDYVNDFTPPSKALIDIARKGVEPLRKSVSPVFMSTDPNGVIVRGLKALPNKDNERPILFVGNHQFLTLDLSLIMERLLAEKGILPRGLGHPAIFTGDSQPGVAGTAIKNIFTTFGAVPVSGMNMFRLLKNKEAVLLFPGGSKEAYSLRGEENTLVWPDKSEIVRMAIASNAILVPFSAIGSAESFSLLLDSKEAIEIPILGNFLKQQSDSIPDSRSDESELYVAPIVLPRLPQRFYFLFGKPIYTDDLNKNDRALCDDIYSLLKTDIFQGIEILLEARKADVYANPKRRLPYELFKGAQAPTFSMQKINEVKNR